MPIAEVETVCYVGAGTMGCYNSLAAAVSGYQVVLYDVDKQSLEKVSERHREMAAMLTGSGYCSESDIAAALDRVTVQADLAQATAHADLVSESVSEDLPIKREVHRQLDEICPAKTIITTNSSVLPVSAIEDVLVRGDRFAALHSHLGSPLVDIVAGPRTDHAVVDVLTRYVESTKGVPLIMQKEYPGYVLNAMLGPVLGCALALLVDGVAKRDEVDRAWMLGLGATMGPLGMIDMFGLNIIFDSWENRELDARTRRLQPKVLDLLRPYIEEDRLGMKSGRGFYDYPAPAYQNDDFLQKAEAPRDVRNALYVALISNAILLVIAGVAESSVIDRAWRVGTYLDAGPFEVLAGMGHEVFRQALADEMSAERVDPDKGRRVMEWLEQQSNTTDLESEQ